MPDVSIAVSARNNFSREFEKMSRDADAFNKDIEELNREITALNKQKATLKTDLDGAKKELREAQKGLDGTAESIERLENAHLNVDNITDELREVSQAARQAQKDLANADSQASKSQAGSRHNQDLFDRLGSAGAFSQIGDVASQIVGSYVSSAYGSQAGTMFGSVLSGAGSGAAIGSMIAGPGVGTAVGAGVGALVGAVSGANSIYQERDDAFKSYVQGQVESQLSKQEEMRESGSSIAAKRETDLRGLSSLLKGDQEAAAAYQQAMIEIGRTPPFSYDTAIDLSRGMLGLGLSADETEDRINGLANAAAALALSDSEVSSIVSTLEASQLSGKLETRAVKSLSKMGLNVYTALADAFDISESEVLDKLDDLDVNKAVEAIYSSIKTAFPNTADSLSGSFEGLSGILDSYEEDMQAAMGEGYNDVRKVGIKDQIAFYSGETGAEMREAYKMIGEFQADLENQKEQMQRDAWNAVVKGVMPTEGFEEQKERLKELAQEYADAAQTAASSAQGSEKWEQARRDMGSALAEAQVIAENEYNASEAAQIVLEGQMALANQVAADTSLDSKYWDAGYRLGEQYSKGVAAGIAENMPPVDSVGIVREATAGNKGSTYGGTSSPTWRGSTVRRRAFGLNRVPYDDYPAMLHEGERVLTANQARQADAGSGVGSINVNLYGMTVREDADVTRIAREMVSELKIAMAARKG